MSNKALKIELMIVVLCTISASLGFVYLQLHNPANIVEFILGLALGISVSFTFYLAFRLREAKSADRLSSFVHRPK